MKHSVILDTDIGTNPDDLFALCLLLKSPELNLELVVTGDEINGKRAQFVRKTLDNFGKSEILTVQGENLGSDDFAVDDLINDVNYEISCDYLSAMKNLINNSDKVTYIGIQGFTNLANLLKKYPEVKQKLEVYQMGGAIDFEIRAGWVEHNVAIDVNSAQYVLNSGVNISMIMAQTTFNPKLVVDQNHLIYKKLLKSKNLVYQDLVKHCEIYNQNNNYWPKMHDPLTVAAALGKNFVDFYEASIVIDKFGKMKLAENGAKIKISKPESRDKEFMSFLYERLFS